MLLPSFISRQDFLPLAHLYVATQFCYVVIKLLFLVSESLSRPEKSVATLFLYVQLISVS